MIRKEQRCTKKENYHRNIRNLFSSGTTAWIVQCDSASFLFFSCPEVSKWHLQIWKEMLRFKLAQCQLGFMVFKTVPSWPVSKFSINQMAKVHRGLGMLRIYFGPYLILLLFSDMPRNSVRMIKSSYFYYHSQLSVHRRDSSMASGWNISLVYIFIFIFSPLYLKGEWNCALF